MALYFYRNLPLTTANAVDPCEIFIGDGTSVTFSLTKLSGLRVSAVQVGSLLYTRDTVPAGFSISGDDVTLISPPSVGAKVIVVGTSQAVFNAFDTATAGTATDANVKERILWLADADEINLWTYTELPGNTSIKIEWTDGYASGGAEPSWMYFAPLNPDLSIGTYGTAGAAIEIGTLEAADEVQVGISAGDTSFDVADGSQFTIGRLIQFNPNGINKESRVIENIVGDTITIAGTDYAHSAGEAVYENGIGFAAKLVVPVGVAGGATVNLYDNILTRSVRWAARS